MSLVILTIIARGSSYVIITSIFDKENIMIKHKTLDDMQKKDIVGNYQTTMITHVDGNTRQLYYTDAETPFPQGKKIISITDADGYITHANTTFVEMSGYSKEELVGMPHYILRHPDMPKVAFAGLWESLDATGEWQGIVKNLRKDGGFYWVSAKVFSLFRNGELVGYTSTREAAPRDKVAECTVLYKQLLDAEQ